MRAYSKLNDRKIHRGFVIITICFIVLFVSFLGLSVAKVILKLYHHNISTNTVDMFATTCGILLIPYTIFELIFVSFFGEKIVFTNDAVRIRNYFILQRRRIDYSKVKCVKRIKSEGAQTKSYTRWCYSDDLICLLLDNYTSKYLMENDTTDYQYLETHKDDIIYFSYTDEAWCDMKTIFGNKVINR